MISVTDYNIVGIGENILDCKANYLKGLASKGNYTGVSSRGDLITITGVIQRIGSNIINGTSFYTFVLNEKPNKLFNVSNITSSELPITRDGDRVRITYVDSKQVIINCSKFDNLNFIQEISKGERTVINEKEKVDKYRQNQ